MAWFDEVPELQTLTYDTGNGINAPLKDHPFVKESPDIGHFFQKAFTTHREVGARVPVRVETERNVDGTFKPKAESVENWRKEHLPKLYQAGLLEAPPAKPEDYGIVKPNDVPEGMVWDDARGQKLAAVLHKNGIPKSAVPELLALHVEALQAGKQSFKTDYDSAMTALRSEFTDLDSRMEEAKRLSKMIFKSDEDVKFLEDTGIGNHPAFLGILLRLAPLASQDSSFIRDMSSPGGGSMNGDQVRAEVRDIMENKSNPRNAGYWKGDKAVNDYIEGLYKKAYGTGVVTY